MAILKILKTKSTFSDDLFLCQVSNGSAVRFPFKKFCTLVTMATVTILNFINPSKAISYYGGYSYKVSWSLRKGIKKKFKSPFFVYMATAAKFVKPIPIFWLISFHSMWMLFLSRFINFYLASNLLWSFLCFSLFFFSILAVSMAMAAILKKSTFTSTTSHGI